MLINKLIHDFNYIRSILSYTTTLKRIRERTKNKNKTETTGEQTKQKVYLLTNVFGTASAYGRKNKYDGKEPHIFLSAQSARLSSMTLRNERKSKIRTSAKKNKIKKILL